MSVKHQVRKVRRDGVTQRYWVNPSREHDDAVTAVIGGDLAKARSRKNQELARQILHAPSVQESIYRSLVRQYEATNSTDAKPMLFLKSYLSRGYPEAESLLVRLATEPSNLHVRASAVLTMTLSTNPRVPRLIREVADKASNEWTARVAIDKLASYLFITMQDMIGKGITPVREAVLDAMETLGLAMQGKWFRPGRELTLILAALNYNRSEFEQAVQGQIPDSVEKTVIDGLISLLSLESLSTEAFEKALKVIKEWRSEYALSKLRSYLSGSLPHERRAKVIGTIQEIEQRLKRKSG